MTDRIIAAAQMDYSDGSRETFVIVCRESQHAEATREISKWVLNPEIQFSFEDGIDLQEKLDREALRHGQG